MFPHIAKTPKHCSLPKYALAFGSDQDYQIDIISELDLANATYGITQVAGLHNNSKAFLFRVFREKREASWQRRPQDIPFYLQSPLTDTLTSACLFVFLLMMDRLRPSFQQLLQEESPNVSRHLVFSGQPVLLFSTNHQQQDVSVCAMRSEVTAVNVNMG
ncbi:Protein kinase C-binding protein NELL1 NEL-like protein 1 [Takifugu flavidus]|uniref:Protein kinase C-binding protein NELL1 NEL-like protein 1 n=1 Tax=Takifugu flavidus TaxID=433684 RepID=A0A5C6NLX7_9TELE|nr:Protein kinase C-binding protein NELL1 NEL-like protein 1 [Takifugu flavidus]